MSGILARYAILKGKAEKPEKVFSEKCDLPGHFVVYMSEGLNAKRRNVHGRHKNY